MKHRVPLEVVALQVYSQLGPGHREAVYQRALACELRYRGHRVQEEVPVSITYTLPDAGEITLATERADLVIDGRLVVEIKIGSGRGVGHAAALQQVRRYRRYHSGLEEAALIFFNTTTPVVYFDPG